MLEGGVELEEKSEKLSGVMMDGRRFEGGEEE